MSNNLKMIPAFAVTVAVFFTLFVDNSLAITRVFVQNNTEFGFSINSGVYANKLSSSHWQQTASFIEPGKRKEILWFNRDEGITSGKEFQFVTDLTYQNYVIRLAQALRGKTINSKLWQRIEVEGRQSPWFSDRDDHWEMLRINNEPVHILFRAYFTGTDDNIEYIITKQPYVKEQRLNSLNVLAYNIYMRTGPFYNGQKERADILKKELLRPWDIIIFSEAFDDDIRTTLHNGLKSQFPYQSRILGSERGFEEDGGVIIFSRWPIQLEKQLLFGDTCSGSDCMADKGVLYVAVKKNAMTYHLFATHTNANNDNNDIKAREQQFKMIRTFIDQQGISKQEPVIIGGDLNVDRFNHPGQYNTMLNILNALSPTLKGLKYSFWPEINDLADAAPPELLDYVLVRKDHLNPYNYTNKVQLIRSSIGWKEFAHESTMYDLSDHFPVEGDFDFVTMITGTVQPYQPTASAASEKSGQPHQVKQMQIIQGAQKINPVADAPIPVPTPIRLQKISPLAQPDNDQQMDTLLPSGKITDCFFKSQNGKNLVFTLEYQVAPEVKAPVYAGGWLYEGRQKAVDAGYTPTQVSVLPKGTIDLPLVLTANPFTAAYAEVFLIQNGKVFGKSHFKFPYTWNGTSGKFMIVGNPLPTDQKKIMPNQPPRQADTKETFCARYAHTAVAQFNMGRQYKLDGIAPPVWSNDKNAHFNWCMQTDEHVVRTGDMMRAQHLLNTLPKATLENMNMKSKGRKVPGLDPGLGP